MKTRENVGDLHFLVIDNFDFPRKLYSFVKIEFLDKTLTFRIVLKRSQFGSCYKTYLFFDHRYWNMDKTFPRGIILTFHVVFVDLELISKVRRS